MIELARALGFFIIQGAKFAQFALILWMTFTRKGGRRTYA
jgi:hypothetical protein